MLIKQPMHVFLSFKKYFQGLGDDGSLLSIHIPMQKDLGSSLPGPRKKASQAVRQYCRYSSLSLSVSPFPSHFIFVISK